MYTHYWKTPKPLSAVAWGAIKSAAVLIVDASEVPVESKIACHLISINGIGDDAHEDFDYSPDPDFDPFNESATSFEFCKTSRKPYDEIVAAILLVAAETGEVIVTSDGIGEDGHDQEWDTAHALAERALEREVEKLW